MFKEYVHIVDNETGKVKDVRSVGDGGLRNNDHKVHVIEYAAYSGVRDRATNYANALVLLDAKLKKLETQHATLVEGVKGLLEALKFYSTKPEETIEGRIEWNPHVCDSYSGRMYAPDWDGNIQDEPGEVAQRAIETFNAKVGK